MINRRPRGDEVLPITLTEVIVLLFFVLTMVFAWNARERDALPDPVVERFVAEPVLEPEAGWIALVRCIDELDKCDPGATDVIVDIATTLGIETEGLTPTEVADSVKRQVDAARMAADSILLDQGLDPTPAREQGPFVNIIEAFRPQGDFPPCWADYSGIGRRIIYAAEVTLFSEFVRVERAWPSAYADSAALVSGLVPLTDALELDYGRFAQMAELVLQWSNAQDPACRHYVMIHDSVSGGDEKETFKRNLLTVEGYFYKNLIWVDG